jgi:hypothetical protein
MSVNGPSAADRLDPRCVRRGVKCPALIKTATVQRLLFRCFLTNLILSIPRMAAQKGSRARSSRIPADLPIEVSIDITDASGVLFVECTTTKL